MFDPEPPRFCARSSTMSVKSARGTRPARERTWPRGSLKLRGTERLRPTASSRLAGRRSARLPRCGDDSGAAGRSSLAGAGERRRGRSSARGRQRPSVCGAARAALYVISPRQVQQPPSSERIRPLRQFARTLRKALIKIFHDATPQHQCAEISVRREGPVKTLPTGPTPARQLSVTCLRASRTELQDNCGRKIKDVGAASDPEGVPGLRQGDEA